MINDLSNLVTSPQAVEQYLRQAGLLSQLSLPLADFTTLTQHCLQQLTDYLAADNPQQVQWHYQVPELGEGGACSLFGVLDDKPYDLTPILGGQTTENQIALLRLSQITAFYQQQAKVAWFGIYQARNNVAGEPVLVKLSYFGAPSRAEFPLTAAFAEISNNTSVGLSGQARIINDVAAYLQQGGEYYTCDPKVQAEACLPLFDQSGKIAGIIDAEDFSKQVFTTEALALLVAVCLSIPRFLPATS